ncbi:uncharacterized protein LOC120256574 isoform X2 [Dioscorea cayenensis subsp. rotundata]|uniref:Uncharacterized protein LOC120256574 isoform X2 n=1 Tax=Dioscorea cayennensis subsp. rotundata TaxID=55577 RepID=A0AB40B0U0_DIOCR|nr:uncharacterized protein LOC120256574 isoform X2 [Dioscorea cayenensis subsp. rotundata]
MGWPLISHTIPFMQPHSFASLGLFIKQNIAKYGRVFRMNLVGKATIVSADAKFNRSLVPVSLVKCQIRTDLSPEEETIISDIRNWETLIDGNARWLRSIIVSASTDYLCPSKVISRWIQVFL